MLKKIIFLLCISFYTAIILSARFPFPAPTPLTETENNIYNAIKKEYPDVNRIINMINHIIDTSDVSVQTLYTILVKKEELLLHLKYSLQNSSLSLTESKIGNLIDPGQPKGSGLVALEFFMLVSIAALPFSISLFTVRLAVQKFMAPSHNKTVISSSLMGAGGILGAPTALFILAATTAAIEAGLKNIVYYPKIKELSKRENEINNEINYIKDITQALKDRYPDQIKHRNAYR